MEDQCRPAGPTKTALNEELARIGNAHESARRIGLLQPVAQRWSAGYSGMAGTIEVTDDTSIARGRRSPVDLARPLPLADGEHITAFPWSDEMTDASDTTFGLETVSLYVIDRATVDLGRMRAAFAELAWLGSSVDAALQPGWRRIATDLELPVRDRSGPAVRTAALIDVGPIRDRGDAERVPLAWRSAAFAPLFPVFAGQLEIRRSSLTLVGRYAPPFGRVGLLIDQALLHFVATRTAQAFLARVARAAGPPSIGSR